jgi:hypothetical protein
MPMSLLPTTFPSHILPGRLRLVPLAAALLALAGCGEEESPVAAQERGAARASRIAAVAGGCVVYGRPRELGRLDDKRITESSGIARSLVYENCFWTHNDGDSPRMYLIDQRGQTVAIARLEQARLDDCEDIASFTRNGTNYLLYADTGDNDLSRGEYRLHLIEERRLKETTKKPQDVEAAMTIAFGFPDGSHDIEAVAVDPTSGKVYLASKERRRDSRVYELPLPTAEPARPLLATRVATLYVESVTAMDISPDGRRAVVLTDAAAFEFSRRAAEDWSTAFHREPCLVQIPKHENGESICYGADGKTLYLTSEGRGEPLWEIPAVE